MAGYSCPLRCAWYAHVNPQRTATPCASLMTIHDDCEEECPRLCTHRPCMTS